MNSTNECDSRALAKNTQTQAAMLIAEVITTLLPKSLLGNTDQVGGDVSFQSIGLDSAQMVEMIAQLETKLGISLEPELAFNYPTVNSLAAYICQNHQGWENQQ